MTSPCRPFATYALLLRSAHGHWPWSARPYSMPSTPSKVATSPTPVSRPFHRWPPSTPLSPTRPAMCLSACSPLRWPSSMPLSPAPWPRCLSTPPQQTVLTPDGPPQPVSSHSALLMARMWFHLTLHPACPDAGPPPLPHWLQPCSHNGAVSNRGP